MEGTDKIYEGRYVDLTSDAGFKAVFCDPQNKEALLTLLNTFLPSTRRVKDIKYNADRELNGYTSQSKTVHVDLRCKDEKGRDFIIEMQKGAERHFFKRCLHYCSKIYGSKLKSGQRAGSLTPVYLIAFLVEPLKEPIFQKRKSISWYTFVDVYSKTPVSDEISIIFVRLDETKERLEDCNNEAERCMFYIRNMKRMKGCPEEQGHPFENIFRCAEIAAFSPQKRQNYDNNMITELDYIEQMAVKYEDGMAKGKAQGKKEGLMKARRDIALALLNTGIDITIISKTTGLSLEKLMVLKDKNKSTN